MIPLDATFRRAEGLTLSFGPCQDLQSCGITVQRHTGREHLRVPTHEAALLGRMSRWQRADELGVPHETLVALVEHHLAYWSTGRPTRDLTGAPLPTSLGGPVALARNISAQLVVRQGDTLRRIPFMPRRATLEGLEVIGLELAVMEMGLDTHTIAFGCCARHGALLRELVPRLDGRHDLASLCETPGVQPIVAVMNAFGLLERHTPPTWDGRAQVTWLGHAAVLYEAAGQRILIDPLSADCSIPSRLAVRPPDLRDLGRLDAVLITHGDNDHLNPAALTRIACDTPIVLPRVNTPQPYHVDMRGLVALLGFERVVEVDEWETLRFGAVEVTAAPFRGEDWGLELACRTYVVASPELTIFANADTAPMPDVDERIAAHHAIDVAFLGVTGAQEPYVAPPRYGYGHFYTPWIPEERASQWVQHCSGPAEAAAAARRLRARHVVGYAAGGAAYHELAYCDRGTHAELAALLGTDDGPRPLALEIGKPARATDLL